MYSCIFTSYSEHIEPRLGIFRILCNCCKFRILAHLEPEIYLEFCKGIFSHIQNALCNARKLITLTYLELTQQHLLVQSNNRNTRKRCEIFSKLTIKIFVVNFEHISYLFLVFLLLTLNK